MGSPRPKESTRAVPGSGADPQSAGIVALLRRPFREFYDFSDPRDVSRLRTICEDEGVRMPGPDEH